VPEVQLSKYVRLFRLKTTTIYIFPLVLALSVGIEQVQRGIASPVPSSWKLVSLPMWAAVLFAYLAYFSGSFFASTLNCYIDVPADRVHDGLYKDQQIQLQPFVTGEMSRLETVLTFVLTGVGCVVFSLLVNLKFAVFMLGSVFVLGILYSHPWFRFKEKPVLDAVTNAFGAVLILIAGMSAVSSDYPPMLVMVFGALLAVTLYIPSVANDAPFDAAAGYRTSGVVFGQRRLIHAMIPLSAIIVPLGVWVVLSSSINWQYRLFDGIAALAAVLATIMALVLFHPPHIELNPLILLVPIGSLLVLYFVLGIVRLAT
jgi:4-hydroxybenzoate polyprenyltransferase